MKRRADGRFQKRITLPNGKSKLLYSSANTEREAIKDFNRQMLALEEQRTKSKLFENVAQEWKAEYIENHSDINFRKGSRASYERTVEYFKGKYIHQITAGDVSAFFNYLKALKLSYKTVASHKSVLSMIMSFAITKNDIQFNPVKDVTIPANLPKTKRVIPSDDVLQTINEHYTGFDFLPYFLLNTGLRMSEALPLEVDKDIDLEQKTIRIHKHLIHDSNKPIIEEVTKTRNAERTVVLLDRVIEKLPKKQGLLFCNDDGTPYTVKQLQKLWTDYRKKYNIKVTAHQLRHGFATMLFEAGIPEKDAQDLMGHSDIYLTRQVYTHIRDKHKKETIEKLNKFSF